MKTCATAIHFISRLSRLATAVSVCACSVASADILRVPSEYATIQQAIDAAGHGDMVEIADGTYTGFGNKDLEFNGKAITVRGESRDANLCIIDCQQNGRGVLFNQGEDRDSILACLTIRNGHTSDGGAGIRCTATSNPTVQDCVIIDCEATDEGGGAVYCRDNSKPAFIRCDFHGNRADSDQGAGGAIYCWMMSSPVFIGCRISGNEAASFGGAIYCANSSNPEVINCELTGNIAGDSGGAVHCVFDSRPEFINCTMAANSAGVGGAVACIEGSTPVLNSCILWDNPPTEIFTSGGSPFITYSDVKGGWSGTGNIMQDPAFVNPINGDYRIGPGSRCIDAGNNEPVPLDEFDLDNDGDTTEPLPVDLNGNDRFIDDPAMSDIGNGDAPLVDIGAFEYQLEPICLTLSVENLIGGRNAIFNLTGGTPGVHGVTVYGLRRGITVVSGYFDYCATFRIAGIKRDNVIGGTNRTFDANGTLSFSLYVPRSTTGYGVLFQSAERQTCPEECVSNLVEVTVR